MNNKQLAEMIKRLRKDRKNDELATTDINTTSNMKGAGHDIVEYSFMTGRTSKQTANTPRRRASAIDSRNQPKGGNDIRGRYVPEEKTEEVTKTATKSKRIKDVINTSPEQDSAMIGTQ